MKDYPNLLFPYAYNILGSVEDARDAVQDVLSSYLSTPKEGIINEKGYLIKSVVHQSINLKNRKKKLSYRDDVWLPEPVATEGADTNQDLRDVISYSLLILLEKLNPKERAVFILKEGFGYSHQDIAGVLSGTVEQSRKLLSRAKLKLDQHRQPERPFNIASGGNTNLGFDILEKYINAIRDGETKVLENLLTDDITFFADGGEKVKVVKKLCTGMKEVIELLLYVYHTYQVNFSVTATEVNHQPALLYQYQGKLKACQVFEMAPAQGKIRRINTLVDPEKLKVIKL